MQPILQGEKTKTKQTRNGSTMLVKILNWSQKRIVAKLYVIQRNCKQSLRV